MLKQICNKDIWHISIKILFLLRKKKQKKKRRKKKEENVLH